MQDKRDEKYYRSYLEHHSVTRRGLFRGIFSGASKSLQNSSNETALANVPRPPYAVKENIFIKLCQSCDNCQSNCPQQIIEMVDNYPQLNLDYNHCTYCGECQAACPSMALSEQKGMINLRPQLLSTCNNKLSGQCNICAQACPQQAITIEPRKLPLIDMSRCNGCGECRSVCFIGAVQMEFRLT